jgi:hypothetical protein
VESPVRRYAGYSEVDQGQSVRLLGFDPAESKKEEEQDAAIEESIN